MAPRCTKEPTGRSQEDVDGWWVRRRQHPFGGGASTRLSTKAASTSA
ncbi:unnamed protein product, partial [Ectocarpus sp. 13 AM-2016]